MRGIAGHPADTDRDTGFKKALAENPGITIAKETSTKWDQKTGTDQINEIMCERHQVRRHLDLGHRQRHRRRAPEGQPPYVPIVGADNSGFVKQLLTDPGPEGRGRDQPAGRRWRRRRARRAAPRRPEARRCDRPRHPGAVGQHHPRRQGQADRGARSRVSRRSGRSASRSRTGRPTRKSSRQGLQGPGRELISPIPSRSDARGCRFRRHPRADTSAHAIHRHEGLIEHDDGPAARGHGRREALRRGRGPALRLAGGPARRGPRAHGRERRRQEHPRQDPDRRRPPGPRHDPRPRQAVRRPLAEPRLDAAGSCRSTRSRRSSPTSTSPRTCD